MKIRRSVFLGLLLGILIAAVIAARAQTPQTVDIQTVTRPANDAEKAFVRAAVDARADSRSGFRKEGLEDIFSFPPFVGAAIEIITEPNFLPQRTAYASITGVSVSGCLAARAIFPSGDSAELSLWCYNQPISLQDSNLRIPIWKGELVQPGTTTFQVFNVDPSGRVSTVSASTSYATNYSGGEPFIGPIGSSSDGSVVINGMFDTIAIAGSVVRNLLFIPGAVIAKPLFPLSPGDYTVTGCLRGICATRIFHVSDQGGSSGGKG